MVRPGEGIEDMRRRTLVPESDPTTQNTVQKLTQERLIVAERDAATGGVTVSVAHEALIRRWQRLRDWIDADREFLRTRERIAAAARLWADEARSPERLLPAGRPLAEGEDLLATRHADLEPLLIDYVRVSLDAARAAEEARQAAQRQRLRRARLLALGMAVLAVVAIGGGVIAWWQRTMAEHNADVAAQQALLARSAELATRARALFEDAPGRNTTAALLAVESLRLGGGSEAQGLIDEILALTPRGVHELAYIPPYARVMQSPDGKINLVWKHDGDDAGPGAGTALALDPATGAIRVRVEQEGWTAPVLSPDGRWFAVGGWGRRFQIVDRSTGKRVIDERRPSLTVAAFSPDGSRLYVAEGGGTVETRAAPDWAVLSKTQFREGGWDNRRLNLEPSPDGKSLLISFGGGAWLGPPSGPFRPLPDLKPYVWEAAFDSTGTRMGVIAGRSRLEIRDPSSGAVRTRIQRVGIESWTFSPDGTRLAIGDEHGIIDIWDTGSGERLLQLDHDKKDVNVLTYTPDGSRLVAAYASGAVRVFKASDGALLETWVRPSAVTAATFGKDGAALYLGDEQGAIYRLDPKSGAATELFRATEPPKKGIGPLALDPRSGLLLAEVRTSRRAYSWTDLQGIDAKSGQELWHQAHNGPIYEVTFGPDGALFAMATPRRGDDELSLWDTATGAHLHRTRVAVYRDGLHFSGDGDRLVVTSGETKVIDPNTGKVLFGIGEPGGVDGMAIFLDRKTVVTYGNDGIMRAWDALSGEERWWRSEPDLDWDLPFSGNAARYAQRTADGRSLAVHDTRSGAEIARIPLSSRHMRPVLSPTGERLLLASGHLENAATGERYLNVELWDADEGKLLKTLRGLPTLADVAFGAENYTRVVVRGDRMVVLDSTTGEILWEEPFQRNWIDQNPLPRVAEAPLVIQASDHSSLRAARTGKEIGRLDFGIGGFTMTADRSRMVATLLREPGETGPQIAMIDLGSGTQLWTAQISGPEEGGIREMRFSKDGRRLFVQLWGSKSSSVFLKVFDTTDGRRITTLSSESTVKKFEQLANPDLIVTLDYADTARVWRLSTGEEVRRVAHGFSTDGASVAAEAARAVTWKEGSLRVWDLRDGSEIAHNTTTGDVEEAALDPAGRRVAYRVARAQRGESGDPFQAILLWKVISKGDDRTVHRIPIEGSPSGLVFDRSGKRLAARVGDHEIRIWDVGTLRQIATMRSTQGAKFFDDHRFSKRGDYYFARETDAKSGGYTSHFRAWRLSGRAQPVEIARLDGLLQMAEGADGTLLTAGKQGGRLWGLGSGGEETLAYPGARFCCSGVAGEERRVTHKDNDAIRALDTASGEIIEMTRDSKSDSLSAAAFSRDFSRVFMAERDRRDDQRVPGAVHLRSVRDGREIAQVRPDATIARILPVDGDEAALLLGSPGGWISGGKYERALLWRPGDGDLSHLNGDNPVGVAEVSPDGRLIVLGEGVKEQDVDGRWVVRGKPRVTVWDARTGGRLHTLEFEKPPTDIAFSADGAVMVVRDSFNFVAYEAGSWRELRRAKAELGHGGDRTAILDGEWIVVPDSKSVRLVSIRSGDEINLRHATDHPAFVLSWDDRVFATVDRQSLRVWEISSSGRRKPPSLLAGDDSRRISGRPESGSVVLLAKFDKPDQIKTPVFAGAENRLYVSGENSLRRLLYRPEELEAEVCRRMGRGLSKREIAEFFPTEPPLNPCQKPG